MKLKKKKKTTAVATVKCQSQMSIYCLPDGMEMN